MYYYFTLINESIIQLDLETYKDLKGICIRIHIENSIADNIVVGEYFSSSEANWEMIMYTKKSYIGNPDTVTMDTVTEGVPFDIEYFKKLRVRIFKEFKL